MTVRIIAGQTYDLSYDAENRLVSVSGPNGFSASFAYDGDGRRVQSTIGGVTTTFVGNHYEVTGSTITKYYYANGQRIAMRTGSTLNYLISDHLGSTSMTVKASDGTKTEVRYKPWGEVRHTTDNSTSPTRYTFTGQYSYVSDSATDLGTSGFGLMYFGARYYDPQLGRFSSADTIIPEQSQGTQAWDRYAFVDNNPLRYTDPSGHEKVCIGYTSQGCSTWYETETPAPPPPPQPPSCAPGETCIVPAPPTPDYWDLDPLHPDYIALTGNWSPLGLAGFTGILVRDRYGRYYFGIGGNLGKSLAAGVPTFTLNGGYIGSAIDTAMPSQGNIGSFLGGLTINGGLGAVGGIAATASPSSAEYNPPLYGFSRNYPDVAPVAVEGGIFLPPSIGISATYSWAVYPSSIMGQVRTWFGAGP